MFDWIKKRLGKQEPEKSYALNELDLKLKAYLCKEKGYFIEAGANDGITQSNTLYFERHRGWRGLLVEPIPQLANICKLNRPDCVVENCALVSDDYAGDTVAMNYCNLMSFVKGAMGSENADAEHLHKGLTVQPNTKTYELMVPARTLTSLLVQHNVERIDFLSLDVEGFELSVLRGLDFTRYRPEWVLVEARFREQIDKFLQGRDYSVVAELSYHDVLYQSLVRPSEQS